MKTAELTGLQLDYWVAKAEGLQPYRETDDDGVIMHLRYWLVGEHPPRIIGIDDIRPELHSFRYSPSTNWADGGPIMDRERTSFMHHSHRVGHETKYSVDAFLPGRRHESGPTMLIAAMRAYIASKYGDEVPDAEGS